MADMLRPGGDPGEMIGGPGLDGQPDDRVMLPQEQVPAPHGVVLGRPDDLRQGAGTNVDLNPRPFRPDPGGVLYSRRGWPPGRKAKLFLEELKATDFDKEKRPKEWGAHTFDAALKVSKRATMYLSYSTSTALGQANLLADVTRVIAAFLKKKGPDGEEAGRWNIALLDQINDNLLSCRIGFKQWLTDIKPAAWGSPAGRAWDELRDSLGYPRKEFRKK